MKKYTGFIAILLLMILSGCSPMPYDDLSESNTGIVFDAETYVITAEDTGEVIQITFPVIYEIKVYGYGSSVDNVTKFENLSFSNSGSISTYTATISKEEIFGNAEETGKTTRSGASSSITIYASKKTAPEDWMPLKSVEVELSLKTAPNLSVTKRTKDSVSLEASSEALSGGMEYKISYGDKTEEFNKIPHEIKGVGTEAFTITVSHRYAGTEEWGELTQIISVPEFDIREGAIDISIDKATGSITASKLSDYSGNYAKIGIFAVASDNSLTELYSEPFTGTSDTMLFDNETVFGGLYVGNIRVVLFDESGNEATACISTSENYNPDLFKINEKIGRQNYNVTIPISPKFKVDTITIPNNDKFVFEKSADNSSINVHNKYKSIISSSPQVGTLESNTDYSFTLEFVGPNGRISKTIPFKTKSFAGEYIWTNESSNVSPFAVFVQDKSSQGVQYANVPSSSSYEYYVYASINDKNNMEEKLPNIRLAPLLDDSLGESFSKADYNSDDVPYSYKWNNAKWNSAIDGIGKVSTVDKISMGPIESNDKLTATVVSTAAILPIPATTNTEFNFYETEDFSCYLVFYNKIDGIGNEYLNTNKAHDESKFENNEFYYSLELQD